MSLDEFQSLYKKEFGICLTQEDLEREARKLLNLHVSLYGSASKAIKQVQLNEEN